MDGRSMDGRSRDGCNRDGRSVGDEVWIKGGDLDWLIEALSRVIAQGVVVVERLRRARGEEAAEGLSRADVGLEGLRTCDVGGDADSDASSATSDGGGLEAAGVNGGVVGGYVRAVANGCRVGAARLSSQPASRPPPRHSREVDRVLRYIEAHYGEVVSLARLASVAGCSRRRLVGAFRRETGESIHQYLMQVRLQRAALEVRAGDKIEAVMLGVGLKSKTNFYRQFKAQFGTTPAAYRVGIRSRGEP